MDKVTVIIPTYNRGKTLLRSIESVLNQTYRNLEVIVVDDNSTDDTEYIIKCIKDKRFNYIKNLENKGACYSRNLGIDMSTGKYIAFQDSDDEWKVDKLQKQLKYLKERKLDIVSCYMSQIYDDGKTSIFPKVEINKINIMEYIYYGNIFSTQTIVCKKECLINDKFDNEMPRFQDWELMIRLCQKYKAGLVNENLVDVYIQQDSISKNPKKAIDALNIINKKYASNNNLKSFYYRNMGIYSLQDKAIYSKRFFDKAFEYNKKSIINITNHILTSLKLTFIVRVIYKLKGRI